MLQVGSLLDNKYKILNEIGHGGMSVVYLAINERANKTWAVKEIRKDGVCDFEAVRQGLVVETNMLKKLNHPHLPSIIDVIDMDDSFIIVMDYIEGRSLQSVIKNGGAQPKELVIEWGIQLCDVLGYLHSRNPAIIYRDMKPANVMLKPNGDVTLIDFGTAREFKNRNMVEDTTCLGTRGYAAPEQFGGRGQTDARTDIYCLGATLYHLLTGHSPAEPPYEIKPLSYWDPQYAGSGIEYIINKCCQQDPAARYQSCAELMYDLEHEADMSGAVQKSRRAKWNAFVASIVLSLVGIAGMVTFGLLGNAQTDETYEFYTQQAESQTGDFNEFLGHINDAIAIDPGRHEAYDVLLTRVEEDGILNLQSEYSAIYACLNETSDGMRNNNETMLLKENPEEYADIQFRMGKLLFLMSGDNDAQLRQAAPYFKKALNNGKMNETQDEATMKKARLAQALETIGESMGALGQSASEFTEAKYSYQDLWDDLNQLVQENPIDSLGSHAYGIALYSRVANMVVKYYYDFNVKAGISQEQLNALVDQIEASLDTVTQSINSGKVTVSIYVQDMLRNGYNNVNAARNMIGTMKEGN